MAECRNSFKRSSSSFIKATLSSNHRRDPSRASSRTEILCSALTAGRFLLRRPLRTSSWQEKVPRRQGETQTFKTPRVARDNTYRVGFLATLGSACPAGRMTIPAPSRRKTVSPPTQHTNDFSLYSARHAPKSNPGCCFRRIRADPAPCGDGVLRSRACVTASIDVASPQRSADFRVRHVLRRLRYRRTASGIARARSGAGLLIVRVDFPPIRASIRWQRNSNARNRDALLRTGSALSQLGETLAPIRDGLLRFLDTLMHILSDLSS